MIQIPRFPPLPREFGGTVGESPQEDPEPTVLPRDQGIIKVTLVPLSPCSLGGRHSLRSPTSLRSPYIPGLRSLGPSSISRPHPQPRAPPRHGGEGASEGRGLAAAGGEGASRGGAWRRRRRRASTRRCGRARLRLGTLRARAPAVAAAADPALQCARPPGPAAERSRRASPLLPPSPQRWELRGEPQAAPAGCLCSASCCCRCWVVSPSALGEPGSGSAGAPRAGGAPGRWWGWLERGRHLGVLERLAGAARSRRLGGGEAPADSVGAPLPPAPTRTRFQPPEFSRPARRVCSGTAGSCGLPGPGREFLFGRGTTAPHLGGCSEVAGGGGHGVPRQAQPR